MLKTIHFDRENLAQLFTKKFFIVILISVPSAIVADFFNVPLAWMIGPMIATSLIALNGFQVLMPKIALSSILIILGLHIGNYIDQSLFSQMFNWIWTTVIMFFYIVVSILIVSKYLQKFSGYKEKTSIFSAAPGALGPLMILAEYEKSDLSQVATAHLIRLIIIITVFPFVVNSLYGLEDIAVTKEVIGNQNIYNLFLLIISSIILILIFDKFKVPAALLAGTLVASGFLQITEIAVYKLPPNIIDFSLLILGSSVGCRFADKSFNEISKNALHSFVATFMLVVLGLIAAYIAGLVIDKNFFTLLLSYCPGGIYEVAVIAIFFNLDPEFVAFHHIIRLLMILFVVPIILRIIEKKA